MDGCLHEAGAVGWRYGHSGIETLLTPASVELPAAAEVRVGLEIELLNAIQSNPHDQQMGGNRLVIGHHLWPGPFRAEGLPGRRPGPDHAAGYCEALPMIKQGLRFLISTDQLSAAPQAELLFCFAEQPAQFNPWLAEQLGRFFAAAIGQQLQFALRTPASKHQGAHARRAI